MVIGKTDEGELRRFIEVEVQRKLDPLVNEVNSLKSLLLRLYNTNGGPPGFLQAAHEQNREKIDAVLKGQGKVVERLDMVEDYIETQKTVRVTREEIDKQKEAILEKRVTDSERKFRRYIAIVGTILGILTLLMGLWSHRKEVSQFIAPNAQSHIQQDATIPPLAKY